VVRPPTPPRDVEEAGLYVVVYRIADRSRARQVDELLRFAGEKLRPGVFEVAGTSATLHHLERDLGLYLREGDLVRIFPVCARCRRGVRLFGEGEPATLPVAWIF
jgi:CRISPR/Cas system-associated endoribonuclease Cas2